MKFPQVVRDLLAARELIARRGLAKGLLEDDQGRLCSRGALGLATTGDPSKWFHSRRATEAERCIVPLVPEGEWHSDDIVAWNNAPERTQQEVLDAFDAAASLALSEAEVAK